MEHQLIEGVICAISTGGDESGAAGFVDGLVERGLLSKDLADNIDPRSDLAVLLTPRVFTARAAVPSPIESDKIYFFDSGSEKIIL